MENIPDWNSFSWLLVLEVWRFESLCGCDTSSRIIIQKLFRKKDSLR